MSADELRAFIVEVRAQADAALARLATVDADALPTVDHAAACSAE